MLSQLSPSSRKRRRVQQQLRQNQRHRQVELESGPVVEIDSSDSENILPSSSGNSEHEMSPQPEEISEDVHPQPEDTNQGPLEGTKDNMML